MRYVLAALIAVSVVAVLEATRQVLRWAGESRALALRRRLDALVDDGAPAPRALLRDRRLARSPLVDQVLRSLPLAAQLERLCQQSDAGVTVARLIAASALASGAGLLAGLLLRLGPGALLLAIIAAFAPAGAVLVARRRRSDRISEQLPDGLDAIARALRAGHALSGAFGTAAKDMPPPLAAELVRVFESQRLGMTLEEALRQLADRVPGNGDVKMLAVAVTIQRESGGNLAELLASLAETIRARHRFRWKLRGLTAEGRASAIALGAMPFAVAVAVRVLSPEYLAPLLVDPAGRLVLAYAVVSWAVGVLWLKRMTTVDL